jgi:chemotaxis protein MotB
VSKKAAEGEKPENHERWIVSYADMVTLLFALFVVLYATSDANPEKLQVVRNSIDDAFSVGVLQGSNGTNPVFGGGGIAPNLSETKSKTFVGIGNTLNDFAAANGLEGKITIRSDADTITISLATTSSLIRVVPTEAGRQDADAGIRRLKGLPNGCASKDTRTTPVNSQDFATNWELAAARASRVLRFLSEQGGLNADKLEAAFFAETRPVAANDTAEGRAQNRRADIVILYPTKEDLERSLAAAGEKKP